MTWIEFADKHAVGLGLLAFFAIMVVGWTIGELTQAWEKRGKK